MRLLVAIAAALLAVLGGTRLVAAEEDEKRLTIAGGGALASTSVGDVTGTQLELSGTLRYGYGLTNTLELGARAGAGRAQAMHVAGARLMDAHGMLQNGDLFFDLTTVVLGVDARWIAPIEVSTWFEHLHPFVGIGGGLLLDMRTGQELLDQGALNFAPADDRTLRGYIDGEVGAEYRVGRFWFVGVHVAYVYAGAGYSSSESSVELSRSWY